MPPDTFFSKFPSRLIYIVRKHTTYEIKYKKYPIKTWVGEKYERWR